MFSEENQHRLQYVQKPKETEDKFQLKEVIFTNEEKQIIFKDVHASSRGSHLGINNTIQKISLNFYWLGIKEDVTKWIKECDHCQRPEKIKTVAPVIKPVKTHGPCQVLEMDLILVDSEDILQRTRKYTVEDVLSLLRDGVVPHTLTKNERSAFFKYSRNFQLHGKYSTITCLFIYLSVQLYAIVNLVFKRLSLD